MLAKKEADELKTKLENEKKLEQEKNDAEAKKAAE